MCLGHQKDLVPVCRLNARAVLALIRASTADEVTLTSEGGAVLVRAPGARFRLDAPSPAIIPQAEAVPAGPCLRLAPERLRKAVHSTLFAAGPGCRRYCLEGVLCEVEPGLFCLVASDNRRLAVAQMAADGSCEGPGGMLPARAVALLARLASEAEAPGEAVFGPRRVWFRTSAAALSARFVKDSNALGMAQRRQGERAAPRSAGRASERTK
jgi:DNA polymerase III sliding clamp (beta) subunit (PCNA family)